MQENKNKRPLRRREAQQILQALEAGVVPTMGIQHLLVGRQAEVEEVAATLARVAEGDSDFRVWVGDFGSGKSFMLHTIEQLALQINMAAATVDLTPTRRFHASDGKGVALYQEIMKRLQTRAAAPGEALGAMLDRWYDNVVQQKKDPAAFVYDGFNRFSSGGLRFELAAVVAAYMEAAAKGDALQKAQALRWMNGHMPTKTEAKRSIGVGEIITDDNWTDVLFNWSEFFRILGYSGLVVNFDECVNLYKLPRSMTREQNYERILNLYNETKGGRAPGLWINLAATRKTIFDERRGMASYGALKGRFGIAREGLSDLVDTTATVQLLKPLTPEEIYTLLEKIQTVFTTHYGLEKAAYSEEQIAQYMQAQLNRPGAAEFLTPRAVIKDFLQLLQLARQNPEVSTEELLTRRFGTLGRVEKDPDNLDDAEISIL
ncbi:BREX system ATP-binding domain-containing protein [Levyella massiliensis]|uniref:BREX system ATP-binding domain-containing protein n=1 Tax=Levyella massiliensis TaxID=938289 RepID=UPI00399C0D21